MSSKIEITTSWADNLREKFNKNLNPKYYVFDYNREFVLDPTIIEKEIGRPLTENETFSTKQYANKKMLRSKIKVPDELYKKCWDNAHILSENVALSKNIFWCQRNGNMVAFGPAGTVMKRSFIGGNILQSDGSMIIHDIDGALMEQYGTFLHNQGYKIKCLNLKDMTKSQHFNPFAYIKEVDDVSPLVWTLITSYKGYINNGDRFWIDSMHSLCRALILYLYETGPVENITFQNIITLLSETIVIDEQNEITSTNGLDEKFNTLLKQKPSSYAVLQYKAFKLIPEKISRSIIISLSVILTSLVQSNDFVKLTNKDELELEKIGQEKTALFIVTHEFDTTFNVLVSMLFHTAFKVLYREGDDRQKQLTLPNPIVEVPVIFVLSNCENIPAIYKLEERMITCRRHNISVVMTFHDYNQMEKIYEERDASYIIGSCDVSLMFVGGYLDASTANLLCMSHTYMKAPIDKKGVHKHMVAKDGTNLPIEAVLANVGRDAVYVFVRGVAPICDKAFNIKNHPNYQFTAEANSANRFTF